MSGAVFAILGALGFSLSHIFVRRAVIKVVDATTGILITVPISVPFFLVILAVTGDIDSVSRFSWQGYLWLSAAGIVHFVAGRSFSYMCVQLVGQNIAGILRRAGPIIAVSLGIFLLGEPLTWPIVAGVLLIVGGITIAGLGPLRHETGHVLVPSIPRKAIIFGLFAGLSFGISPILVKMGLEGSHYPVAGVFISYSAATIVWSILALNRNRREELLGMQVKTVSTFAVVGLLSSTAQLMRYIALSSAPVSIVAPLFNTSPIFALLLSFVFNRRLEIFSRTVIAGTVLVVAGGLLLV